MNLLYLRNDIFLADIIGYDRLKFSHIYTPTNEILRTPLLILNGAARSLCILRGWISKTRNRTDEQPRKRIAVTPMMVKPYTPRRRTFRSFPGIRRYQRPQLTQRTLWLLIFTLSGKHGCVSFGFRDIDNVRFFGLVDVLTSSGSRRKLVPATGGERPEKRPETGKVTGSFWPTPVRLGPHYRCPRGGEHGP